MIINHKKTQRINLEKCLAVRRSRSRRLAVGTTAPYPALAVPNQRRSFDFAHDQMGLDRRFRVLDVVDDLARECLAAVLGTSINLRF